MVDDHPPGDPRLARESLLVAVFEESPVATLRVSVSGGLVGPILEANPAAHRLFGRPDLVGRRLTELAVAGPVLEVADRPTQHLLSVLARAEHGDMRWIEATLAPLSAAASPGGESAALVLLHDVTERRAHDHRRDLAGRRDALTGLANRHELLSRIADLSVADDGPWVAALFLDLDRFKRVNDGGGHAVGDELLCVVAQRISGGVRPADTVARVGGDEFVVLCPGLADAADARGIAGRVLAALREPVATRGGVLRVTASVGLASARVGAVDPATLLHAADRAMYAAKAGGRNRVAEAPAGGPAGVERRLGLRWGGRRRSG